MISVITNLARAAWGKKGCEMTTPEDFMPRWGEEHQKKEEPKKQSVGDMKKILQGIAKLFKGK